MSAYREHGYSSDDAFYKPGDSFYSPSGDYDRPPSEYIPDYSVDGNELKLDFLSAPRTIVFEPATRRHESDSDGGSYTPKHDEEEYPTQSYFYQPNTSVRSITFEPAIPSKASSYDSDEGSYTPSTTSTRSITFEPAIPSKASSYDSDSDGGSYTPSTSSTTTTTTTKSITFEPINPAPYSDEPSVGRSGSSTKHDDDEYPTQSYFYQPNTSVRTITFEPVIPSKASSYESDSDGGSYTPSTTSRSITFEPANPSTYGEYSDKPSVGRSEDESRTKYDDDDEEYPTQSYFYQPNKGVRTITFEPANNTPSRKKTSSSQIYDEEYGIGLTEEERLRLALDASEQDLHYEQSSYEDYDSRKDYDANNNNNTRKQNAKNLKIIFLGNLGVGKSSIAEKVTTGLPLYDHGHMYTFKSVDGVEVKVTVWDTHQEEKNGIDAVREEFYRGADGVVFVFDVNKLKTYEAIDQWYDRATKYINRETGAFLLVGNKLDVENEREVAQKRAQAWCQGHDEMPYYETSVKEMINIKEAIETIVHNTYYKKAGYKVIPERKTKPTASETGGGSNKKSLPPPRTSIAGIPVAPQKTLLSEIEMRAKEYIKDLKITQTDLELSKAAALNISYQNPKAFYDSLTKASKDGLMLLSYGYSSKLDQILPVLYTHSIVREYADAVVESDATSPDTTLQRHIEENPKFGLAANMAVAARFGTLVDCLLVQFENGADHDPTETLFKTIEDMYDLCYAPWHMDSVTCSWLGVYNMWRLREVQYKEDTELLLDRSIRFTIQ
jgi:GTPase SAR1 family protein